jgi:hypothetical protein
MDKPLEIGEAWEPQAGEEPLVEETSVQYLRRWSRLVSTSNWHKGRIIVAWRNALEQCGAPAGSYSDEAWSRRVGSVSPQHVGRLRRVYERFGRVRKQYSGLYWSHFQAALDWPDAEMWLEGAVQNGWSVAETRRKRWEAIGAPAELKPRAEDVVAAEFDEDSAPADEFAAPAGAGAGAGAAATIAESLGTVQAAEEEEPAAADFSPADFSADPLAAPPEQYVPLPPDLSEAVDALKLVILRHKHCGWREVSCQGVLAALEGLKQVALAPAE